jgi:hypothetical protein
LTTSTKPFAVIGQYGQAVGVAFRKTNKGEMDRACYLLVVQIDQRKTADDPALEDVILPDKEQRAIAAVVDGSHIDQRSGEALAHFKAAGITELCAAKTYVRFIDNGVGDNELWGRCSEQWAWCAEQTGKHKQTNP